MQTKTGAHGQRKEDEEGTSIPTHIPIPEN